ncbi:DUF4440 domain-containing protein [Chromobacterium subtsugae]|uniref:nuclear transport factor 2 family protein n=1 Tax=Chromobacterium subtsugae TaxID=251747 RepID=UPI00064154B5|nr:nuclear transport factor 2 family protein [Chromobacterium subtsugae]
MTKTFPATGNLLPLLQQMEQTLHQPAARADAALLERWLDSGFREIGRSGRQYDKPTIMAALLRENPGASTTVHSSEYRLTLLAEDIALLTYHSAHAGPDGALSEHTLRSSIWKRVDSAWRLAFHQGTPAPSSF